MIQVVPLVSWKASGTRYLPVLSVGTTISWALSATYGIDSCKCVIPAPGTFKNLFVYSPQTYQTHPAFTITLYKNGSPTSITVTLNSGESGYDIVNTFSVVAGDDVAYRLDTSINPGFDIFLVIEFEPDTDDLSIYSLPNGASGSITAGHGSVGGAFYNGVMQGWDFTNPSSDDFYSNTYSIASSPGNITGLSIKSYRGDIGSAVVTAYIRLNKVLQDGTGGTVDTSVSLTGATAYNSSSFTLPIIPGDHVEYAVVYDSSLAFGKGYSVGCSFISDNTGEFMICGGDNSARSNSTINYTFTGSQQLVSEIKTVTPVGISGFDVLGLYVEHNVRPGAEGKGWTDTVRKNQVDTAATVTVLDPDQTGLIVTTVSYSFGDFINLSYNPINNPVDSQFHWGLSAKVLTPEPPPPDVEEGPLSGIYFLSPGKTNDTIYQTISLNTSTGVITATTTVVDIPNPYVYTALIGDE